MVYGANGSGKSKLFEALRFMQRFVLTSFTDKKQGEPTGVVPFLLSTEAAEQPSEFEILFYHAGELFRYGFEATAEQVVAEWLYHRVSTKETELFYRAGNDVTFNKRFGTAVAGLIKENSVRENTLVLSLAAQLNQHYAKSVQEWFYKVVMLSGLTSDDVLGFTMRFLKQPALKPAVVSLLQHTGVSMEDAATDAPDETEVKYPHGMPKEFREHHLASLSDIRVNHRRYDANQLPLDEVSFSLADDESAGTQKLFAFAAPLLDVLKAGAILAVDELDSRLHPSLVCKIVQLFHTLASNPHNAQLLFNTHDTNLLSGAEFRRDQIWFTEKDRYGAATLYSLADFKTDKVRKGDNFERNYIEGRYGAVPYLGDLTALPPVMPLVDEDAG